MKKLVFKVEDLKIFVEGFLRKLGVPAEDARIAADVIVSADLRGVDSHGIIRLNTYYGSRLRKGSIDPTSKLKVIQETATTLAIDGMNGLGQVTAFNTMQKCIEKARSAGVAFATVRNSNHYGIAGYYAMMALQHDMIGISFTNSQPLVAPTYGRTAMLGTNPIAVAVPSGKELPYVLDMATSIVPIGRITVYEKSKQKIPEGWGINSDGCVTSDPAAVLLGGALMPLGGTDIMRGYKGYGLALLVEIFCGVLAGASFGPGVGNPGDTHRTADVGHFFAAVRVDAFRALDDFKEDMDRLISQLKDAPKALGQDRIFIHGEKEFELTKKYSESGIPLLENVVEDLRRDASEIGLDFDLTPINEITP